MLTASKFGTSQCAVQPTYLQELRLKCLHRSCTFKFCYMSHCWQPHSCNNLFMKGKFNLLYIHSLGAEGYFRLNTTISVSSSIT